ncbi:MAG: type II secretion system minor pseudopilin GspI [Betaproteobacteria bacterium]|nr:type II secretion system minor pseudopilin GspI [Betaproteobacteria bacterium]
MSRRVRTGGFTLVEVLVALAIVAVALMASLRAVGSLTQAGTDLRLRVLAQWSAENRLSQMRVQADWPPVGQSRQECPQAGVALICQEEIFATPNPFFRRVEIAVYEAGGRRPLARLTGFVTSGNS